MDVARIIKENGMLGGLSPRTIKTYSVTVDKFLRTYRLAPHQITQNHIKTFLLRKLESGAAGNTVNVYLNALKFFYGVCLNKKLTINLKFSKVPKTLPEFLTQEECIHFFSCIKNGKHKLMITLMYSAGLRVSELLNLRVKDFQFEQNYGWVRQGKGKKDRVFIIADQLMDKLLIWITKRNLESENYLFTNSLGRKMSAQTMRKVIKAALKLSGIPKNVHPHTLRHSFATHLIENGYSVTDLQPLLGHSRMETTLVYTHLASPKLLSVKSPFDNLQ
jgi:integrase/recombinase XerD